MLKLVFFDTETTGNTDKDFLCQIAYKSGEEKFSALYKPSKKIPPEASAVHHITNKMVEKMPVFSEDAAFKKIKKLFEDKDTVLVAHNAPFDIAILKNEGIVPEKFICTLRIARYLDKDEVIPQYKLQYLRYYLNIDIDADAHDALGDVLVLEKLFERQKKKIMEEDNLSDEQAIEKMVEISSHPTLMRTFNFGKYNGRKIEEVLETDRGYLVWLLEQKQKSDGIEEDWIYTLKHYLEK